MIQYETVLTVDGKEAEEVFLAQKMFDVLRDILEKEGWKPSEKQLSQLERAVYKYCLAYKKATLEPNGNWNIVIGQRTLKETTETAFEEKGVNKARKKRMLVARRMLLKTLRKVGADKLILSAPTFAIILTSYLDVSRNELYSYTGTRRVVVGQRRKNTIKVSERYGEYPKVTYSEFAV